MSALAVGIALFTLYHSLKSYYHCWVGNDNYAGSNDIIAIFVAFKLPLVLTLFLFISLHSNSNLDINIKGQMMRDLLNMAMFRVPNRRTDVSSTR